DTVQCVSDVPAPDTTLVTATDNCGAVHVTHLSDVWGVPHAPLGNVSCAQVLTRTYRVTDLCGNFADCQQLITVFDTEAPHVACGAPQTIECNSTPVWGTPTVTDNCDPSPALAYTDSSYTGTCPQNELLVRIWQATDLCGNVGACRQTITVHDSHAPDVSSGPPDTTVACAKDVPAPDASRVHATDNCGTVTVQWVSDVPSGTSCNQTITRTYSVTDQCTNSVNYIQTIHVIDNVNPQIACAAEEHVACGSPINFTDPTATDNCDPAPVVSVVSTTTTNGPGPGEVTHTRTWKATDSCGNFAQCSQNIIEGACACSIAGASSVCPSSTHQYCGPVDMSSYDWSISGDGSITSAHNTRCIDVQAGSTCSGSFTLTLSLNGGASQCQKTVTVTDVTGPVITVCPPPDTVQCMSDVPAPNTGLVQATDSCSAVTVAWAGDVPSGTCPTTVTRTYRANDACGNHTDCVQLIIVRDTLPPSLVCAPDGRIACGETVVFTDPQATDNCDPSPGLHVQSTTTTPGPGPGEYTHTRCWTASDVCGNVSAPCCQNIVESACPYQPLTLSKDDGVAGSVAPGDTIHYTIACGNPNNQGVTGVVITDHLPPEVAFVSASSGGTYDSNTRTVTWTVGALGGSAGNDWMLSVEVDPMIAGPTSIVNTCAAVSDQTGTSTAAETTHVEVPVIQVYIDIKPTACPNPLYINAKGVLPVAILGTAEIDVARIETSSLRLTRDGVAGEIAPVSTSLADVATPSIGGQCSCNLDGPDGNTDLVANFALKPLIQALGLGSVKGQTVVLTLKGLINPPPQPTLTKDGVRGISGSDCVMVTSGTGHDTIWIMESRSVVSSGSQAKFSFSLTENDHVRVEVFDVHGRMVQSLMDSDLGEGTYSVDWNICDASGQRVPIGIYFVRLTTRTQNATKKIVVVE
ncbi:MAG TPA: FlgD immunoglobulin-like domain containing protein, partial [bacterium]|nr:FlgD immunoglobulin-like domain containing protein [bacterium]